MPYLTSRLAVPHGGDVDILSKQHIWGGVATKVRSSEMQQKSETSPCWKTVEVVSVK